MGVYRLLQNIMKTGLCIIRNVPLIDGQVQVLNSVSGNGNGGTAVGTGFQSYQLNINVAPGSHDLSLFCFNSKKTFADESTSCVFDNIVLD